MTAQTAKALTGTKNKMQAISVLASRFKKRNWRDEVGRPYEYSGMKELKYVQLTWIASVEPGVATYRIIRVPVDTAVDCISGQLTRLDYEIAA